MSRMDEALKEAEREEQLRIARPYSYTRQRLDANTRAINTVRSSATEALAELHGATREAIFTVRAEADRDNAYTFGRLADRIDQLTFALIHAGILPPSEAHSTVLDYSDQYGGIPGCKCGDCPEGHLEGCRCRECEAKAAAARWASPEAREQRRLARAFLAGDA